MASGSDISKLRLEMDKLQAQVMSLYKRGIDFAEISARVNAPEKSVRVMVSWYSKKGWWHG